MRRQIVERISQGAPPEAAARARQLLQSRGNLMVELVTAGFAPAAVLDACAAVTALEPAPIAWLRSPAPPMHALDANVCRQVQAAPIAEHEGSLCIAYANPETAARRADLGFPPHRAFLAMPAHLERALALLSEAAEVAPLGGLGDAVGEVSGSRPKLASKMAPALAPRGRAVSAPSSSPPPRAPAPLDLPVESSLPQARAPVPAQPERSTSGPRPRQVGPLDPVLEPSNPQKRAAPSSKVAKAAGGGEPKARTKFSAPATSDESPARSALLPIIVVVVALVSVVAIALVRGGGTGAGPSKGARIDAPEAVVVIGRQQDLLQRASAVQDHKRAIELLDSAIKMDPASSAARVALLERMRRRFALSRFEDAQEDLKTLRARPDANEIGPLIEEYTKKLARAQALPTAAAE